MTHRDRAGGFPRLSDGVAHGFRCPASPRHALLAENLGKPSLWVIIKDLWYEEMMARDLLNYHPLTNEATTSIAAKDLLRFMAATGHRPEIVDFAFPGDGA